MGTKDGNSIVGELKLASRVNRERLEEGLKAFNTSILEDGKGRGSDFSVPFAALARILLYLAIAGAEKKRKGSDKLRPSWSTVIEPYNKFCKAVGGNLIPLMETEGGVASDDSLIGFCTFATRRTGNHTPRFYAGLAAFIVHLDDEGALDTEFLNMARPEGERSLPDKIRVQLRLVIEACQATGTSTNENESQPSVAQSHPEIHLRFAYLPENLERFETYRHRFARSKDRHAHFVLYRPSRSNPERLMKSFLAIGAPVVDENGGSGRPDVHRFVHIYKPPEGTAGGVQRVSLGRALPLEEGIYLVGGQRDETSERRPFSTLKVIALPWYAIHRQDPVLNALIMSANYAGKHIVSRAALRATPVDRAEKLKLGGITVLNLQDDLRMDAAIERDLMMNDLDNVNLNSSIDVDTDIFPLCCPPEKEEGVLKEQSALLSLLCNNYPNSDFGWDVSADFLPIKSKKGDGALTKHRINFLLEDLFGSKKAPKYAGPATGPFDFWSSIRFGPLTHE